MLGIMIKILFQTSGKHLIDINVSLIIKVASFQLQTPNASIEAQAEEEEVQDRCLGIGESTVNLEKTVSPPSEEVIGGEAARIIRDLSNKLTSLTPRIRYLEGTES